MSLDLLNVALAFLEGLALIVSPCILPILPFILAGSLDGGKERPFGIVIGFVLAFSLFTFFSRALVRYSGIDLTIVREASYILLLLLGFIMLSSYLSDQFSLLTQRLIKVSDTVNQDEKGGLLSGIIFGGLVGLIWTPCAGPILAAVIVQSVFQQTDLNSFLVVLAFGIGAVIPMLLIVLFGRTLLDRMNFLKKNSILIRKLLGLIVILSVFYMIYIDRYPTSSINPVINVGSGKQLIDGLSIPYAAPDFAEQSQWINSKPLRIADLKGKVVLVDFWTYSCINCIRTFPYLKDWYQKYHSQGLEIIGVHSPEFEFEKNFANVSHAVKANQLHYPILLDNQFVTWQNYQNRYWPAHYLIDKEGKVVYQHFGEGAYDVTENNIRFLLGLEKMEMPSTERMQLFRQTPELYLGYARAEHFAGPGKLLPNTLHRYAFPASLSEDQWALYGEWQDKAQFVVSGQSNAMLKLHFTASKVFMVMGSATGAPIQVHILFNDKEVTTEGGADVKNGLVRVDRNRLYEVLAFSESMSGILQITALSPGLEIYTFTFGNE